MSSQRQPSSTSERKLYWVSGVIACLAVLAGIWQWIYATPQINTPTPKLPEPNGYDFYLRAGQAYVEDTKGVDDITDGSGRYEGLPRPISPQRLRQMYPVAEKEAWLRRNAKALKLLREGNQHPSWQPPIRSNKQRSPQSAKFRALTRALVVESRARAERGNWQGAANSALDGVAFGHHMQRGGPLLAGLVGVAMQAMVLRELRSTQPHLDAATARQAAARMEHLYTKRFPYAETLQEEKWYGQASLLETMDERNWRLSLLRVFNSSPRLPRSRLYNSEILFISKRQMIDNYTRMIESNIANAKLPYTKSQPTPSPDDPYTTLIAPVYERSRWNWARGDTNSLLTMTMLALHAFKLEKGRYPAKLDELTPECLKQIPTDPFGGGEALRYRLENQKYTLWSIGPDGVDNQGKPIVNPDKPEASRYQFLFPESEGDVVAGISFR